MNKKEKQFIVFMESVCTSMNCKEAFPSLVQGFELLCEAHRDRTTGRNDFGKTIRDQNNYDRKTDTNTKTRKETTRRFGGMKSGVKGMGLSGKYGPSYDLKTDYLSDTGDNSGISKTGRRIMKRKFNNGVMDFERKADADTSDLEFDHQFDEDWLDATSWHNMKDSRRHDVLNNTISADANGLSSDRYDYLYDENEDPYWNDKTRIDQAYQNYQDDIDERKNDCYQRGDWKKLHDIVREPVYTRDDFKTSYDDKKNYALSDEGIAMQNRFFEDDYDMAKEADAYEQTRKSIDPTNTVDEDEDMALGDAYDWSGYKSPSLVDSVNKNDSTCFEGTSHVMTDDERKS